eukprot:CCRYP_020983-RA/>CCRYP_020983-RA protein AED:0.43 eAED:0.47 QI:0/0/0/1/0/0/3/0/141
MLVLVCWKNSPQEHPRSDIPRQEGLMWKDDLAPREKLSYLKESHPAQTADMLLPGGLIMSQHSIDRIFVCIKGQHARCLKITHKWGFTSHSPLMMPLLFLTEWEYFLVDLSDKEMKNLRVASKILDDDNDEKPPPGFQFIR